MLQHHYHAACMAELAALKPGNVHAMADGHGMTLAQFAVSADVSAPWMAKPTLRVGQRILYAAQATWQAVGCNTNLGILLLCAPIAHAYQAAGNQYTASALQDTLAQLSVQDAIETYQAIQTLQVAGMGQVAEQDVHHTPSVTLLQAMQLASERDMVARQYAESYQPILSIGLPLYAHFSQRWQRPAWAVTALYVNWMAEFVDSHVVRKWGMETALALQQEAILHRQQLFALDNPKLYFKPLMQWDAELKQRGINPGTSADLTVATLLLQALQ